MLSGLKVLIVDDQEDLAEIVSESLEKVFSSSYVTCAAKAYSMAEKGEVDVIISDANMPGMSGLELLEKLKGSQSKVLFYLATGDIGVTEEIILQKGGQGVFEKPFSPKDIVGKIKEDFEKIL